MNNFPVFIQAEFFTICLSNINFVGFVKSKSREIDLQGK